MFIKTITVTLILFFSILLIVEDRKPLQYTAWATEEGDEMNSEKDGKQLFMLYCASCHHATRDLTGPSFYNISSRWKNKKLLYQFIKNSPEVIKKDAYSKALFERWNKVIMPANPDLKDADINKILEYVDAEAKKKGLL